MISSRIVVLMLCLCSVAPIHAEGESAETDFSEGFERLAALGLPPIDATAVWTKVPVRNPSSGLQTATAKVKGNGWSLPAVEDRPRATVPLGATRSSPSASPKANPPAADLAADVATLIGNLRRISADEDPDYSSRWVQEGDGEYGTLLIFAAQIRQSGQPRLANQLATALFQLAPDRRSIIDSAIHALAEPLYDEATNSVFESGDWAAYHRTLDDLVTRFPRGWESRPIIASLILPQLERQAAGEPPALPELPDIPLHPAALEAIARLGVDSAEDGSILFSPWLLSDTIDSTTPLGEIAALGIEAIPALAALIEDPYLVNFPSSELEEDSYSYFSDDESPEDRILRLYRDMLRPATRGEIARQVLEATLPLEEEDDFSEGPMDPATLREIALAFWRENREASREDLAVVFLDAASSYQRSTAAEILATSTDPTHHAKLEAAILDSESLLEQIEVVTTYVRARKTGAKSFVEQFSKNLRAEYEATDPSDLPWRVREAGSVEGILKPILALSTGTSPRALARDIGRGDPEDAEDGMRELEPLLETLAPKPHLHALLEGAFAAKDAGVREKFLLATFQIDWETEDDEEEEKEESPLSERVVSGPEANVWKKLLEDERPCISENLGSYGVITLRQLAALALENSTFPGFHQSAREARKITGVLPADLALTRAEARLSGQSIPPLPDPSKVSRERLTEIIAEVAKLPVPEIQPHLKNLSHDEQAAWISWMWDHDDDLPVPPEFAAHAFTVVTIGSELDWGVKDQAVSGLVPGFKVTKQSLADKIDALSKDAPAHSRTSIWIAMSTSLPGLETVSVRPPLPDPADEAEPEIPMTIFKPAALALELAPESTTAVVHASIQLQNERAQAVWLHETDGSVKVANQEAADGFFTTLETAAATEDLPFLRIQIQVLSRADAANINLE